jgi:hypothetical protein
MVNRRAKLAWKKLADIFLRDGLYHDRENFARYAGADKYGNHQNKTLIEKGRTGPSSLT